MRHQPKWMRGKPGIVITAIAALAWIVLQFDRKNAPPPRPGDRGAPVDTRDIEPPERKIEPVRADFDFYLLALSWHPAFCADGNGNEPECGVRQPHPLVIHGLWPERLAAGAYPHDCRAPRLDLAPALARQLEEYMPGMSANLHEHEWRKHGGCSGLDDDLYFEEALSRARYLDATLRVALTTIAGRETTPEALRAAADRHRPGLGATLTLQCRTLRDAPAHLRNRPYLIEVRQCIDNDGSNGAPGTLLDCAAVKRRDQGCGRSFRIAEPAR